MTPFLISEVLREIFLHIANPCELSGTYSIEGLQIDYTPIISMYLKCLEDHDIKSLLNQGIDISLMTDYNQMQLGITNKKPMFNYPGFLRVLYYEQMINEDNNENNVTLDNNAEEIIMKTLLQLCLKHGSRLYGLHLNPDELEEDNDEMYEILLIDNQLKNLVSPVRSLHIYAFVIKIEFELWARHHDDRLVNAFGEAITSLISLQTALVSFSLTSCKAYTRVFIPPLKLHSSTLRYIRFDKVNFKGCDPWYSIAECRNIELLEVIQCKNLEEEMVGPVTKASFGKHFEVRYVSAYNNNNKFKDWVDKVSGSVVGNNICGEKLNIGKGIFALLSV
ncbi:24169_t:CDS:2 [Dentiscutata erythropus]|uniref:24169_t:CDS:1 n=1 Tax=Dentiscutata erythropus TaxID=1348616 RepID=A0A9N8W8R4_9GLOM|nr:24169_t:CDS:2 [Dentiscutata erythropus]